MDGCINCAIEPNFLVNHMTCEFFSLLIRLALCSLLVGAPSLAHADKFVRCVQEQLAAGGRDVGTVDGQLGPKTRNALSGLRTKYVDIAKLPPITRPNAAVFCRKLGLVRNSFEGWSSDGGIVELVAGTQLSDRDRERFQKVVASVEAYYFDLGVIIPSRIAVVVSPSANESARLAIDRLDIPASRRGVITGFTDWCRGYGNCGKSYGGVVAISFDPDRPLLTSDIRKLISHEVAHEIQAQYVGNFRAYKGDEYRIRKRGPKWLTEALAIVLDMQFSKPKMSLKFKAIAQDEKHDYQSARLRSFRAQNSSSERDFEDYSRMAGLHLVSQTSLQSIFDFWEKTPEIGWQQAFEDIFNVELSAFYLDFDDTR